jgi:hypothetical protein
MPPIIFKREMKLTLVKNMIFSDVMLCSFIKGHQHPGSMFCSPFSTLEMRMEDKRQQVLPNC